MVKRKLLQRLLGGRSDANIRFKDLRNLLLSLGFKERTQVAITSTSRRA